jgi:hypothetical protein
MASELDGLKRYLNLAGGLAGFAGIPVFDQQAIKVVNVDRVGVAFVAAAGWAGDDAGVGHLSPHQHAADAGIPPDVHAMWAIQSKKAMAPAMARVGNRSRRLRM